MYEYAVELIKKGLAYVDDLTADQIREHRGTLTAAGQGKPVSKSIGRRESRSVRSDAKGEFPDGCKVLRAKIDMASPNLNLRDPVMYRILHESHHNTGDKWCIYPMYDWAHGFEDSLEKITHSICTLEFENHRPLYDWFIDAVNEDRPKEKQIWHPQQIEFARLNLTLHDAEQAQAAAAGGREDRARLGRSAHADDQRVPARGYTPEASATSASTSA